MLNVIKEYLVGIGFKADLQSYNQTQEVMNKADKMVKSFAVNSTAQFAAAGVAATSFFVLINAGLAKFIGNLATADLENQKFARQMWINQEYARVYKSSLDALGVSLQDLYYSPELMQRFQQLRSQAFIMQVPGEYEGQMKNIRSIIFEFQRLKLEAGYSMQWVGYYLYKYLEEPIRKFKASLKSTNENITKDMPHWTKDIAQVASWFARLGITVIRTGDEIFKMLGRIPDEVKKVAAALAGVGVIMSANPFTLFILGIGAVLLMLDDFYTYLDGGEAQFAKFWEWLIKLKDQLKDDGSLERYSDTVNDLFDNIVNLKDATIDLLNQLSKLANYKDFGDFMENGIIKTLNAMDDIVKGISEGLKTITYFIQGDFDRVIGGLAQSGDSIRKGILDGLFGEDLGDEINKSLRKAFNWGFTWDNEGNVKIPFDDPDYKEKKKQIDNQPIMPDWSFINKLKQFFGSMNKQSSIENQNFIGMHSPQYILPQAPANKNVSANFEMKNYIYSNDPNVAAESTTRKTEDFFMRNFQGVFR